jgi:hypothetical protein
VIIITTKRGRPGATQLSFSQRFGAFVQSKKLGSRRFNNIAGKARALVSGDRALLALAGAPGLCPILSVEAFCRRYLGE